MGTSPAPMSDPEPEAEAPDGLIALGSELQGIFDRLARRQGNRTLVQFRVLEILARQHPDPVEPLEMPAPSPWARTT